jgi:hypothetical protein
MRDCQPASQRRVGVTLDSGGDEDAIVTRVLIHVIGISTRDKSGWFAGVLIGYQIASKTYQIEHPSIFFSH